MVLISPNHTSSSTTQTPRTDVALIGEDLYSVLSETDTLGFVYKTGTVFVALSGHDFAHAVEVGQSLSWQQAIDFVRTS